MPRAAMERFLLSVRRRMPDNPYHCWAHVVDVTQVNLNPASGSPSPHAMKALDPAPSESMCRVSAIARLGPMPDFGPAGNSAARQGKRAAGEPLA